MHTISDVQSVQVVDDNPGSREVWGYTVENARFDPIEVSGPLGSLQDYLARVPSPDAALCDYQLNARNYASFSGAELVAALYGRGIPGLLCTRFGKVEVEAIRPYRRWIPSLLTPSDLNEDTLVQGMEECFKEFSGVFRPSRKPWRALVRFLYPDEDNRNMYFVELPGWDVTEMLKVKLSTLPPSLQACVKEDHRCFAWANLGSEASEDLYLYDWEVPT